MTIDYASQFRAKSGAEFSLAACPTRVDIFENKKAAKAVIKDSARAIAPLAHRLYGEANRSVLIVLQGMDTSGKGVHSKGKILKGGGKGKGKKGKQTGKPTNWQALTSRAKEVAPAKAPIEAGF